MKKTSTLLIVIGIIAIIIGIPTVAAGGVLFLIIGVICIVMGLKQRKKQDEQIIESVENTIEQFNTMSKTPYEQLQEMIIEHPSVQLKKDEVCFYQGQAETGKRKTVTTGYSGGGRGASFRVAKGISIHAGSTDRKPIRKEVIEKYPASLHITNQRVICLSEKYGFTAGINSILKIDTHKDGLTVYQASKTHLVLTGDVDRIVHVFNLMSSVYDNQTES